MNPREQLLDLLRQHCRTGDFTLASGAPADFYIDCRPVVLSSPGIFLAGEVLTDLLPRTVDALGGMATGAIPLVSSVICTMHRRGLALRGFWVRPEPKGYGTGQLVEGMLAAGDRVIILDDVVTSGRSALNAAYAARQAGGQVVQILALVDRQEGAADLFAKENIPFGAVYTKSDLKRGN